MLTDLQEQLKNRLGELLSLDDSDAEWLTKEISSDDGPEITSKGYVLTYKYGKVSLENSSIKCDTLDLCIKTKEFIVKQYGDLVSEFKYYKIWHEEVFA